VANDINKQQIIAGFCQTLPQTGNLTRRTSKKDKPTGIEMLFNLPESIAEFALHILGTPQSGKFSDRFNGSVYDLKAVVESGTKHNAAVLQGGFSKQREHAAGRTLPARFGYFIEARKHIGFAGILGAAMMVRADLFTAFAIGTAVSIGLGIVKTLAVGLHSDTMLRTNRLTGSTAAAMRRRGNCQHFFVLILSVFINNLFCSQRLCNQ
jgi:hypothetical protein